MNILGRATKRTHVFIAIVAGILISSASIVNDPVIAADFNRGIEEGAESARGVDQVRDLFGETDILRTLTNVLLFVLGAIAVIMIIIGGLRYVVSGGDSTKVQEAKNTILYAVVGIIVAILSYAIVDFVINSFTDGGSVSF